MDSTALFMTLTDTSAKREAVEKFAQSAGPLGLHLERGVDDIEPGPSGFERHARLKWGSMRARIMERADGWRGEHCSNVAQLSALL